MIIFFLESLSLDLPEEDNSSTFEQQDEKNKEDKNEEKHSIK